MQIWASPFKTARFDACKWSTVGKSGAVTARLGGCMLEHQLVLALWEKLRWGETHFYNEKEKGFTRHDLLSLPPPYSQNHSIALCSMMFNQMRATWSQTQGHWNGRKMQRKQIPSQHGIQCVSANVWDLHVSVFPHVALFIKTWDTEETVRRNCLPLSVKSKASLWLSWCYSHFGCLWGLALHRSLVVLEVCPTRAL